MSELIVAVVTPFKNNKVDFDSLRNILAGLVKDTDGILLLGSTAEATFLSLEEKKQIVELAFLEYPKKIIIGLDGKSTKEILEEATCFDDYDIYAFLVAPISYVRPTQKGLVNYYMELADKLSKPIIIYEIPKRCGVSIEIESLKILRNHYNIAGIKDASGNESYTMALADLAGHDFIIYGGDDARIPTSLLYRASGVISVFGNKYPLLVKNILNEFPKIDTFIRNKRLIDVTFIETSPLPIKYMLGNIEAKKELGLLKQSSKDKICAIMLESEQNVK